MSASVKEYVHHLHSVHSNALDENAPRANVDSTLIKLPLHPHQQAVLHKMYDMEQKLNKGMDVQDECLYSNYGILGDSVGVGKSLMVLARLSSVGTSSDPKVWLSGEKISALVRKTVPRANSEPSKRNSSDFLSL